MQDGSVRCRCSKSPPPPGSTSTTHCLPTHSSRAVWLPWQPERDCPLALLFGAMMPSWCRDTKRCTMRSDVAVCRPLASCKCQKIEWAWWAVISALRAGPSGHWRRVVGGTFDYLLPHHHDLLPSCNAWSAVLVASFLTNAGSQQRRNREGRQAGPAPPAVSVWCSFLLLFFFHFFFIFSVLRLGAARLEEGKIVSLV